MYITQAFKVLHDFWRYLIGIAIVIFGVIAFSLPHLVAITIKTLSGSVDESKLDDTAYIMGLFEPNLNLVFLLLPFAGGFVFLLLTVKLLHKQTIRLLTTAREKVDWKRIWFAFFFWGIISMGLIFIDYSLNPEGYVYNFKLVPFLILALIAVILIPFQTSFEEYLFRGYLMQGIGVSSIHKYFPFVMVYAILAILGYVLLTQANYLGLGLKVLYFIVAIGLMLLLIYQDVVEKMSQSSSYMKLYNLLRRNSTPLIITSAVFGLLHIANPEVEKLGYIILVYYIGTGLFLGIVTLMDDGLELAIGFHAANNLFTALLVTADWTAFQTHSVFKDMSDPTQISVNEIILPIFIIFPILLFIFSRKYKWTDWKEKLFGTIEAPILEQEPVDHLETRNME
jgi:membrane protease YdiL (CAAX protease family)